MDDKLIKQFLAHAEREHPKECCGVVVDDGTPEMKYLPLTNVHADPENYFTPSRDEYLAAHQLYDVVMIIHSHTGDGASTVPSDADRAQCDECGIPYGIVSWPEGDYRELQPVINKPLIGRPFVLGKQDCYGLVMEWHRRQGVELMDFRVPYPWWEKEEELFTLENFAAAGFVECDPVPGCMVVAQVLSKVPNHCGVLIGDNMILHHLYGRLSAREIYNGSWIEQRKIYCVRHKDLPAPEELKPWQ